MDINIVILDIDTNICFGTCKAFFFCVSSAKLSMLTIKPMHNELRLFAPPLMKIFQTNFFPHQTQRLQRASFSRSPFSIYFVTVHSLLDFRRRKKNRDSSRQRGTLIRKLMQAEFRRQGLQHIELLIISFYFTVCIIFTCCTICAIFEYKSLLTQKVNILQHYTVMIIGYSFLCLKFRTLLHLRSVLFFCTSILSKRMRDLVSYIFPLMLKITIGIFKKINVFHTRFICRKIYHEFIMLHNIYGILQTELKIVATCLPFLGNYYVDPNSFSVFSIRYLYICTVHRNFN